MKQGKKVFIGVLLAAGGLICLGLASYILFFEDNIDVPFESEEKNAALATVRTVTYIDTKELGISGESSMCLDYGNGCVVTTANILNQSEYSALGWALEKDSENITYKTEEDITIHKDITLYSVVKEKTQIEPSLENINVCNKNIKCYTGNSIVDTACSQVGYIEKESDDSLEECTVNSGTNNHQKYGNNGNIWDAAFINWVFNSAKISLKDKSIVDVNDVSSYVEWAIDNNKWFTSKSALNQGDLVLTNNNQHIGIALNLDNEWYMIAGNHNNKVELAALDNISGFISMKGLAY